MSAKKADRKPLSVDSLKHKDKRKNIPTEGLRDFVAEVGALKRLQAETAAELDALLPSKLAFIDYFNLCAEEWIFREAGYIYHPVWESWVNGMRQYARDLRVAELWRKENQTNSYYGFELPVDMVAQADGKG